MVALKRKKPKEDGRQKIDSKPIVESKTEAAPEGKSRKIWILIGAVALVVIIGGLATSTLLEFLVRPALFWRFGRGAAMHVVEGPVDDLGRVDADSG